jgi:uncharacterized protein (TIGR02217 family)
MTFLNQRLPTKVEIGAQLHDAEDIEIVATDGGFETRNARSSQSLRSFEISFPAAKYGDAVHDAVIAQYKVARGPLHEWRFRDFTNYRLTAEVIGAGDGAATTFQITQSWTVDGNTESRPITRPVDPVQVFKGGVLQSIGYTVDYDTGVITFTVAPADGVAISVTGEFDLPARFDTAFSAAALSRDISHIDTMTVKELREI